MEAWNKANALYRDGSKLSQPLASKLVEDVEDEEEEIYVKPTPIEQTMALLKKLLNKLFMVQEIRFLIEEKAIYKKLLLEDIRFILHTGEYEDGL
jgi:ribonucleoside-diphosphate reductase alpha chain